MSYTIEYAKQFIRSGNGITPCWLAGDNNVSEPTFKGRWRRAREWAVFLNLVGVTKEDILNAIQPSLGGYGEHWKNPNGKWVDDDGLIRWVKNGCKTAASIEDIISANHMSSIHCYVYVWKDLEHEILLNKWVSTTDEFDEWIDEVKELRKKRGSHNSFYPVVDFGTEKIVHPAAEDGKRTAERVIMQRGSGNNVYYLTEHSKDRSSWSRNIKEALVLNCEDAKELQRSGSSWLRKAKLVNADAKDYPYNAVIRFVDGYRAGSYVEKRASRSLRTTPCKEYAHRYKDGKAAEQAMKKMQPAFLHVGTMAVEIIE